MAFQTEMKTGHEAPAEAEAMALANRNEAEAWKIAQLAATLASRLSRDPITREDSRQVVMDAEALLAFSRERAAAR